MYDTWNDVIKQVSCPCDVVMYLDIDVSCVAVYLLTPAHSCGKDPTAAAESRVRAHCTVTQLCLALT